MGPDEWRRIRALLDEALQLEPEARAAFLDERCAGDPPLRHALDELIPAHDRAGTILESWNPATEDPTVIEAGPGHFPPGTKIGHFKIREFIEEGAFGEVYAAEQVGEIRRKVALKVLKRGQDGRGVVARFELERQILALVDHPNIARIHEAGTTPSGRPWFAMEYVDGVPITEHCDKHRLDIAQRLTLFAEVCDALQHAHQKGIIHRDVKPSNVLVEFDDAKAVPKIIDFGVAKALDRRLTARTIYTQTGQLVGTFAYMSPEQARLTSQDIDTRSDIYSLGVLLYELLTGLKPLDDETLRNAAFDEKLRLIREDEPVRPSTKLTSGVHSVDTAACAQRRRLDLPALTRLLRGDLDWITMCALEKDRSRRYASASEFAQDIRRYLADQPVSVGRPGLTYRVGKFVRRNRTAVVVGCLLAAVLLVGTVAITASVVARQRAETELGKSEARDLVEQARLLGYPYPGQARKLLQQAAAKDPDNPDVPVELARVDWRQGDAEAARARLEPYYARHPDSGKAAALLAGLTAGGDPERSARYRQAAEALVRGDALHYALGIAEPDPQAAVEHFTAALEANPWMFDALSERAMRLRALEDLEAARRDVDLAVRVRPELPMTHVLRGAVLLDQGDNAEAIRSLTMAIEREPDWIAHFNRAIAHAREGRLDKALTDLDAGLTFAPEEVRLHRERGRTLFDLGRFDEAAAAHGRVIELGGATAYAHWDQGAALLQADRSDEAEAAFTTALGLLPADRDRHRAHLLADRGHNRMLRDDLAASEEDLRRSLALDASYAHGHMSLCHLLWRLGRYEEAVASCERGVELKGDRPVYVLKRGLAYWFAGDYEKALPDVSAYKTREPADAAWIPLWEWALHHQIGDAEAAGAALAEAARSEDATVRELAQLLEGSTATRDLPASATDEEARFKARVILGLHATLVGDLAAAKAHLEEALTMNFRRDLEYELARWATRR